MPEDEGIYEIMPYKEIVNLKKQIDELKAKASEPSSREMLNSISSLAKNIDNMLQLFKAAAEDMKAEEGHADIGETIAPLKDKIDMIVEQNKTIAEGMVAVADMVKDFIQKADNRPKMVIQPVPETIETKTTTFEESIDPMPRQMPQRPFPGPMMSGPGPLPDLPEFGSSGIPPPPPMPPEFPEFPGRPEKRGLFGRIKK